ncbi:MAG TPA: DUF5317 domain-containing protein [Thermomicrobiales bacterium]
MLLLLAAVIGTLGGLWHGGALRHFARLSFRWPVLFLGGLILRAVAFSPIVRHDGAAIGVYVLAIACLAAGIAANRRIVGIELVLLGLVLNAIVILANGGAMPVSADALRLVGRYDYALQLRDEGPLGHVELATAETVLRPLADIIPLSPVPLFQTVASVGDLLIAAGMLIIFYVGTLRPPAVPTRPTGDTEVVQLPSAAVAPRRRPNGRGDLDIPA